MSIHVIHFMCGISIKTATDLRATCLDAVRNGSATELVIHMSSTGGSLHEGFTLYHFFKSLPVKVTITNAGSVESAGVMAYLGGHKRLVSANARFVFHPWTWDFGAGPRHIPAIREALHSLEADMARFVSVVAEATGGAKSQFDVKSSETAAKVVDAQKALEHGIAHEIRESTTPTGAKMWWINQT
jgi:ATP-dependent Clp protease, protease subunit